MTFFAHTLRAHTLRAFNASVDHYTGRRVVLPLVAMSFVVMSSMLGSFVERAPRLISARGSRCSPTIVNNGVTNNTAEEGKRSHCAV